MKRLLKTEQDTCISMKDFNEISIFVFDLIIALNFETTPLFSNDFKIFVSNVRLIFPYHRQKKHEITSEKQTL